MIALEYVTTDGQVRKLGKLAPRPNFGGLPRFKDRVPLVPRDQWRDIDRRGMFPASWILDQGQHSSCVGNGAAAALRRARFLAGKQDVALSPAFVYSLINRNRDAGAIISDALQALIDHGTCTFETVGQDPIFQRDMPREASVEAPRFRASEAYHAGTWDEIGSGVQLGYLPVYGIQVGRAFDQLDQEGVAGFTSGPGNHCMMADGMKRLPSGRWALDNVNSWKARWGDEGRCYLVERHFQGIDPDCFLIRAAHEDPEGELPPKVS